MPHRAKRVVVILGALLGIVMVLLLLTKPSSPEGLYVSSESIGAVGDWYEEFADGKVTWVLHEQEQDTYRKVEGSYAKIGDAWVFLSNGKQASTPVKIECSWFGRREIAADGHREFKRRRFIRGRRPDWMLRWLPWWVQ